jgi:hypothetical protein
MPGCPFFSAQEVGKAAPDTLSLWAGWWCAQVLDEVERRRGISAALVYPFMRSLMESPFPAPGKTIKVKTFLPGAGNEVGVLLLFYLTLYWGWTWT